MITVPSDELLFKYVAGSLDPALRLLVERHVALHPATMHDLAPFERFGGLMLAAESPAALTAGCLDRAIARLAPHAVDSSQPDARSSAGWPSVDALQWRWAGPGRAIAPISIEGSTMKSYALRIAPGKTMLQHSHADHEWTLIIQGAYRDESGEYQAGAFIEEDEDTNHRPTAVGDVDCICLAVMSGPLRAPGLMGQVAQWLMR